MKEPVGEPAGISVLYLHGFGSCQQGEKADFFRRRLAAVGVAVWSFDFQGHGESGGGMRGLSLSRCLDDVELVRAEMARRGEERVVLLGSSMGGLCGLWFAARNPESVVAGLYVAPALGLEEAFVRWYGEEAVAEWERKGVYPVTNELGSWELGWRFMEDLRRHAVSELMGLHRTPSLLIQGRLDDRVSWRQVADFAGGCEGAGTELHLFADGDHRLIDRKQHIWELMRAFLRARSLLPGEPA